MKTVAVATACVVAILLTPVPTVAKVLALVPVVVALFMVALDEILTARAQIAAAAVADADTVEWVRLLNATNPDAPCFESRPTGAPLICGRDDGHVGHHIAFGDRHRIIATWAPTTVIPTQRRPS